MHQQTGINQSALACFWNFILHCVYIFLHQRPTAGAVRFVITRFIPAKGLLNALGCSVELLDQASIDASRINRPPSPSLRPFPCSEAATGRTAGTVNVDKVHLRRHGSRKRCSLPPQPPSRSAEGHLYKDRCEGLAELTHLCPAAGAQPGLCRAPPRSGSRESHGKEQGTCLPAS